MDMVANFYRAYCSDFQLTNEVESRIRELRAEDERLSSSTTTTPANLTTASPENGEATA